MHRMTGGGLRKLAVLVLCSWLSAPGSSPASDPDELFQRIELLSANGATQLALRLLDEADVAVEQTDQWLRAEQLRFAIYTRRQDWDGLAGRLDRLPAELSLIHQNRLVTNAVELLLRAGRGNLSRRYLRDLIWRGFGDSVQLSYWRRLLIRSYLLSGQVDDARIAMDRYQAEYAPSDQDWSYLYGLTLLKSGSYERAAAEFSLIQTDRARALDLLSRLRADGDPASIADRARTLERAAAKQDNPDDVALQRIWAVQAEAAARAADGASRVRALEKLFSRPMQTDVELPVGHHPADLWQAYRALAAEIGNRYNLLRGDDQAWLARAESLGSSDGPGARSIYALMAGEAAGETLKDRYHGMFYDVLRRTELEPAAVAMYTDRSVFPSVDAIPNAVRHRIVRYAVQRRDIELAARMARDLTATYEDQDPLEWNLIRARLAIYSGDLIGGVALLREIVTPQQTIEAETANRIMQLLFDLQSVDSFESAYELFGMIQQRVASEQQKREIFFWMGDSMKGLEKYEQAAELYIKSAVYGGEGFDIWGQTARYHAAEALALAGMLEDARRMYEALLRTTTEPSRVMSLQRKLQDLWLREQELGAG